MALRYLETMLTPDVLAAEARAYGAAAPVGGAPDRDALGPDETAFVAERDSFYMGTVSADGWPYVQHRGGPPGFLRVLDAHTLAFADLRGNRQLLSTGNVAREARVALFLMDYPGRRRLKFIGRARVVDAADDPALADRVAPPALRKKVERVWTIDVVGFDWNCPAYITPRFTASEVEEALAPLRARIAELESQAAERSSRGRRPG
jgi:uncharacterized protein